MVEIKLRFQEILRGNPLLESWFLQLFPKTEEDLDDYKFDVLDNSLRTENAILIPAYLNQLLLAIEEEMQKVDVIELPPLIPVESELIPTTQKENPKNKNRKRTIKSYFQVIDHSPPKNKKSPEKAGWTREEDNTLFSTINGLNDCPEYKVLKVLYDTFPEKTQEAVVQRFRVMVDLVKSLVKSS